MRLCRRRRSDRQCLDPRRCCSRDGRRAYSYCYVSLISRALGRVPGAYRLRLHHPLYHTVAPARHFFCRRNSYCCSSSAHALLAPRTQSQRGPGHIVDASVCEGGVGARGLRVSAAGFSTARAAAGGGAPARSGWGRRAGARHDVLTDFILLVRPRVPASILPRRDASRRPSLAALPPQMPSSSSPLLAAPRTYASDANAGAEPASLGALVRANNMRGSALAVQGAALALMALVWQLVLSKMGGKGALPLFAWHPMVQVSAARPRCTAAAHREPLLRRLLAPSLPIPPSALSLTLRFPVARACAARSVHPRAAADEHTRGEGHSFERPPGSSTSRRGRQCTAHHPCSSSTFSLCCRCSPREPGSCGTFMSRAVRTSSGAQTAPVARRWRES